MKISILTICFLLLCIGINPIFSQPCNPVNCRVGSWSAWSTCSHHCGTSGTQNRRRQKTSSAQCGGQCPYHLVVTRPCNRDNCHNGGTPNSGGCSCRLGYEGTCCEKGESPSWKILWIQAAKLWTNVSVWASWRSKFRLFKFIISDTIILCGVQLLLKRVSIYLTKSSFRIPLRPYSILLFQNLVCYE